MSSGSRGAWGAQIEEALRNLRDIDGASVVTEGDEIREIHVVTSSDRSGKQLVRDIETAIQTRFNRAIDRRVVSIAFTRPSGAVPAATNGHEAAPAAVPEPPPVVIDAVGEERAPKTRVRFVSVNLFVMGSKVQAQVELRWNGVTRTGAAAGVATRESAYPLVAAATIEAVKGFLSDDLALAVERAELLPLGRRQLVVVFLLWMVHRQEKPLTGACTVEGDVLQAVVLATLAAINRLMGGLRTKAPVEILVRPTSA